MYSGTTYKLLLSICFIFKLVEGQRRISEDDDLIYNAHSYLVKLEINETDSRSGCSGSIISSNWIITAAHCIAADLIKVNVIHGTGADLIAAIDRCDVQIHPEYYSFEYNIRHDVALLYIRQKIRFNDQIKPIELVTTQPAVGETGIIAGYGETESCEEAPRETSVMIRKCPYKCAYIMCSVVAGTAGRGDSGGPLAYNGRLAGIVSMISQDQRMCLTYYTSVVENTEWIQSVMNGTL